jgi:hypothetical protein
MSPEPPVSTVFVSYSRADAEIVKALVYLFAAVDVPVFRDEQSIKPGRKWRVEIDAALEQCQTILVFWCCHSSASSEVYSEYKRAILLGKRVVPVLVDDTLLPFDLGQYQGVDLRRFAVHKEPSLIQADAGVEHFRMAFHELKSRLTAEFGEYTPPAAIDERLIEGLPLNYQAQLHAFIRSQKLKP